MDVYTDVALESDNDGNNADFGKKNDNEREKLAEKLDRAKAVGLKTYKIGRSAYIGFAYIFPFVVVMLFAWAYWPVRPYVSIALVAIYLALIFRRQLVRIIKGILEARKAALG